MRFRQVACAPFGLAYRVGGEEFLIVLTGTSLDEGMEIARSGFGAWSRGNPPGRHRRDRPPSVSPQASGSAVRV